MSWKLVVLLLALCTTQVLMADLARGKRFMTNAKALSKVAKIIIANSAPPGSILSYLDDDDDSEWSPSQEFQFPTVTSKAANNNAPKRPRYKTEQDIRKKNLGIQPYASEEARRSDKQLLGGEAIAREHAQLVHDINGLSVINPSWGNLPEMVHFVGSNEEREDLYMEDLQMRGMVLVTTTTPPPASVTLPYRPMVSTGDQSSAPASTNSPPVIVIGGNNAKIIKTKDHPYRFVGAAATIRPLRILPMMSYGHTIRNAPTLWQRFVSIFPRLF